MSQNEDRTDVVIKTEQVSRNIDLYYRTADMMIPSLQYAKSPEGDQIAVSVSLVPTFDPVEPQDFFQVVEDE